MNSEQTEVILHAHLDHIVSILSGKAQEYADDTDRLHNFTQASKLLGVSRPEALAGFLAKHTISIFDMVKDPQEYTFARWDEKINDSIVYLILLRMIILDDLAEAGRADLLEKGGVL